MLCGSLFGASAWAQEAPLAVEDVDAAEPGAGPEAMTPANEAAEEKPESEAPAMALPTIVGPVAGYTYFHRAGATLEEQRADLGACRPAVLSMDHMAGGGVVTSSSGGGGYSTVYIPQTTSAPMSTGAAVGAGVAAVIVVAIAVDAAQRAANVRDMHLNYENCMLARGWSVVALDRGTGRQLDRLSETRLATRLEAMVGAAAPLGVISRQFGNEHQYRSADDVDEMSLSLQIMPDSFFGERGANDLLHRNSTEDRRRARERDERERERDERRRVLFEGARSRGAAPIDPSAVALPGGSALIVLRSRGPSLRLVRVGAESDEGADSISLGASPTLSAYEVPAGEWRLVSLSPMMAPTSLCLGAPIFSVGAGEVVFAGAFASDGQPDLALDGAHEHLAARPDLAERLQAAAYRNGSTFECGAATFLTAFEISDAPYVEGYAGPMRASASE